MPQQSHGQRVLLKAAVPSNSCRVDFAGPGARVQGCDSRMVLGKGIQKETLVSGCICLYISIYTKVSKVKSTHIKNVTS